MVMPPRSQGFEDVNLCATGYQMHCKMLLWYSITGYLHIIARISFVLWYVLAEYIL